MASSNPVAVSVAMLPAGTPPDPVRKIIRHLWILGIVAVVSGCVPSASITSNIDQSMVAPARRVLVIESIGDELGNARHSFKTQFQNLTSACHAAIKFIHRPKPNPLALDNSALVAEQHREENAISKFSADAILLMTQKSVTWETAIPPEPTEIDYIFQFYDAATRKRVWMAEIDLYTNYDNLSFGDPGDVLAKKLTAGLIKDHLIGPCPSAA